MARASQTRTAVLGVLTIEPATGYEIRKGITEVLGHFWHESFGQIYPCLAELVEEGLVEAVAGDRARSSRFRITRAGRQRLQELLEEPVAAQPPRNGLLLRTFFGQAMTPRALATALDSAEQEARARLGSYAAIRSDIADDPGYAEHGRFWEATLRAGELTAEASLTWVRETRESLGL